MGRTARLNDRLVREPCTLAEGLFLWMKHPHLACYFFCGACTQACRSSSRKKTARGSSSRCALAAEFFRTAPRDYPTTRVYDFFLRLRADVRVASPAALP